jgi:hypothetical protein
MSAVSTDTGSPAFSRAGFPVHRAKVTSKDVILYFTPDIADDAFERMVALQRRGARYAHPEVVLKRVERAQRKRSLKALIGCSRLVAIDSDPTGSAPGPGVIRVEP